MYDKQYHVYRVMLREVSRWTERCKHIEWIESTFHIAQYYLSYLLVVQTQNKYAPLYNLPTTHGQNTAGLLAQTPDIKLEVNSSIQYLITHLQSFVTIS